MSLWKRLKKKMRLIYIIIITKEKIGPGEFHKELQYLQMWCIENNSIFSELKHQGHLKFLKCSTCSSKTTSTVCRVCIREALHLNQCQCHFVY